MRWISLCLANMANRHIQPTARAHLVDDLGPAHAVLDAALVREAAIPRTGAVAHGNHEARVGEHLQPHRLSD